jgi:trans-2,3-dihydro-3-hydroxyanthranilate isomerase
MELTYHVVDVFTSTPLEGNSLAVFPDATGVDAATMQRIARELSLSETTFILPEESNDRGTRVRIFTPAFEMEFAGHPTIGTAFVMRRLGIVARESRRFILQENVGEVSVRVDDGENPILWLTTPPIEKLGEYSREQCATMLGIPEDRLAARIPCELLSAGNPSIFVAVDSPATVDQARVDTAIFDRLVKDRSTPTCVFVFAPTEAGAYSRMFAHQLGISEDPATGSVTGPLAFFMMKHGLVSRDDGTHFVSEQGTKMGRPSLLHVNVHGPMGANGIEVGGHVAEVATAVMRLRPLPSLAEALPSSTLGLLS